MVFKLSQIPTDYNGAAALCTQINLFGFIDDEVFLTKSGDLGMVFVLDGVDYECLDTKNHGGIRISRRPPTLSVILIPSLPARSLQVRMVPIELPLQCFPTHIRVKLRANKSMQLHPKHCFDKTSPREPICLSVVDPSEDSVPTDLVLASDFNFCYQYRLGSS